MTNSKEILRELEKRITLRTDPQEIRNMLLLAIENVLGLTQAHIMGEKPVNISPDQNQKLIEITARLNEHEPIQYILEEAWFYGRKFKVNSSVLIPRPETELLIEEIQNEIDTITPGKILDIGTGSGCIAITLAKELPFKHIVAIDISDDALKVARENAIELKADVDFIKLDVRMQGLPVKGLDVIVSNPPYVRLSEKGEMQQNVLAYEPHLALFVPDDDPLIFYKIIAVKGFPALQEDGKVIVEINEKFAHEVVRVFTEAGFAHCRIVKDFQQKNRIVIASKK